MSRSARKSKRKNRGHAPGNESPPVKADPRNAPHTATIASRDISQNGGNSSEDWPRLRWPPEVGARGSGFQVIVKRSVLNAIHRHGHSNSDVEVCGVLVGNVVRDEAGPFLIVEAGIQGEFAGHSASQVTFTAETWNHIHGVMDRDHPDQRIVGWYHTHPGFGIFLSDMDLFIHGNFFNLPWQVAMVHDPSSGEDGLFIWRDGKAQRSPIQVEEDVDAQVPRMTVPAEIATAALADFSRRMQRVEKRQKAMLIGLIGLLVLTIVIPFVLATILADRRAARRSEKPAARDVQPAATHAPSATTLSSPLIIPTTRPATQAGDKH